MSKIIGIDLGTTFSAVAHIDDNQTPKLIPNETGDRLTPSVLLFEDGEFFVGKYAKQNAPAVPEQTVEFVKREIGKSKEEFFREFNGKQYSAEELSAEVLKVLKQDAEAELGTAITDAVITVPAYFNDAERQATIRAGEIAGLKVHRIINEPTAAAIAYGMHQGGGKSRVLVFDLGGGTFDVTIMEIDGQEMEVLATNGNHRLGGKDWDDAIIVYVAEMFASEHGEDPLQDLHTYQDLQLKAIAAKESLSQRQKTLIICNYNGKSSRVELTRKKFEELTSDLVIRCRGFVELVLIEANLTPEQIDTVLLVGGSTRLPMIQDMLAQHFGKPPDTSVNPDEAVAVGAAGMGALIQSEQTEERRFIGAGTAPIAGGIMRISDVCSHSLGIVALDEIGDLINSTIIEKNTNIPCEISRDNYETTSPDQTEFDVIVVQGDMQDPRYCPVRDAYEFYDIPPRPAGETRLKVAFKYDASGVIDVEAEDVLSGRVLPKRKKEEDIDWESLVAPAPVPIDIALVIDCSGSMSGEKISDAKNAAVQFLNDIDPSAHIGLVSFQSNAHLRMQLTQDFIKLRHAIESLDAGGGNSDEEAIALARDRVLVNSEKENVLVLLADGYPNDERAMIQEAERTKQQGVQIIVIGVGDGVDSDLLKQVASTPKDYYFVEESVQLESTFTTIASRLVTESSLSGGSGLTRL